MLSKKWQWNCFTLPPTSDKGEGEVEKNEELSCPSVKNWELESEVVESGEQDKAEGEVREAFTKKKRNFMKKFHKTVTPPPYCFYEILIQNFDRILSTYGSVSAGREFWLFRVIFF